MWNILAVKARQRASVARTEIVFPVPEQVQQFHYFFGSRPSTLTFSPKILRFSPITWGAPPLKASVTSFFRLPIIFYFLSEPESGQRRCFAGLFFQSSSQSAVSCVVVLVALTMNKRGRMNLCHAVRAHHGKQSFSPTMSVWIQLVPHRECAHAGNLSHRDLVPRRHGSRP